MHQFLKESAQFCCIGLQATEKDLRDNEMKNIFNSAVDLIKEFNKYYIELSNEKEL